MNDVIQIAKDRRAELMAEIEERMAEVEKLEAFLGQAQSLAKSRRLTGEGLAQLAAE